MKNGICVIAAAGLLGLGAAPSFADTLNATYTGVDKNASRVVGVQIQGQPSLNGSYYAGSMNHTIHSTDSPALGGLTGKSVGLFCIEFEQNAQKSSNVYNVQTIDDAPDNPNDSTNYGVIKSDKVHAVIAAALELGWMQRGKMLVKTGNKGLDRDRGAAIQLLIWESLFEDDNAGWDLLDGEFIANVQNKAGIKNRVTDLLNSIDENQFLGERVSGLYALTSDQTQDQLVVVPLPPAALAGLAGLAIIGGVQYRRRREQRKA